MLIFRDPAIDKGSSLGAILEIQTFSWQESDRH